MGQNEWAPNNGTSRGITMPITGLFNMQLHDLFDNRNTFDIPRYRLKIMTRLRNILASDKNVGIDKGRRPFQMRFFQVVIRSQYLENTG